MGCLFMRDILFYCSSCFKSSSGVVIGAIPKFSTRYCSTLGETNAGRVGPRRIFLMPKMQQGQQDTHRLLLIPGKHHGQRQIIHAAAERIGKRNGNLNRTVGIIALPHIHQIRGRPPMVPRSRSLKRYLPQASVSTTVSAGCLFYELRIVIASGTCPVAACQPRRNAGLRRPLPLR